MAFDPLITKITIDVWKNFTPLRERWLPYYNTATSFLPTADLQNLECNRYSALDGYIDVNMLGNTVRRWLPAITYLRINNDNNLDIASNEKSFAVYYFVNSYEFIPNGIRFYVTRDNYMTEIASAEIFIKNIRRCNKYCGVSATASRLNIPNTYHWNDIAESEKLNFKTANIRIFAQIQYTGSSSVGAAIYNVHTFAFKFNTNLSGYEVATQIRNIYSVLIGPSKKEQQASVLNIWIGVTDWYGSNGSDSGLLTEQFKTYDYRLNSVTLTGVELPNVYREYPVILTPAGLQANARPIPLTNPNNIQITTPTGYLGVGGKWDKLELPNIATQETVMYRIWVGDDGLKIVVDYKGLGRDITENYAITNVTNDNQTSQKRMANALSSMAKIAGSAAQIATGSPIGAVMGVAGIAGSITDQIPQNNGQYVTGGNGLILWDGIDWSKATTPLFFIGIAVEATETGVSTTPYLKTQYDIYYNGAEMDGYSGTMLELIENYLMQEDNYLCGFVDSSKLKRWSGFMQADVEVSGVSLAAKAEIEAAFAQGINFKIKNE